VGHRSRRGPQRLLPFPRHAAPLRGTEARAQPSIRLPYLRRA
jgi:hypothetical protein